MPADTRVVRSSGNNSPIVQPRSGEGLKRVHFDVLRLSSGEDIALDLASFEVHLAPLSGRLDVEVDRHAFEGAGSRSSVWDGKVTPEYLGTGD